VFHTGDTAPAVTSKYHASCPRSNRFHENTRLE
jgi:hypothetical protein